MPHRASLRLVVDTNVWVSSLLSVGIMALAKRVVKDHHMLISVEQLKELGVVLARPKFFGVIDDDRRRALLSGLATETEIVTVTSAVNVCRDPDDDMLLALCKDGRADGLITGDKDLLVLGRFGTTRILSPAQFLAEYK